MAPWRIAVLLLATLFTGGVIYVVSSVGLAVGGIYRPVSDEVALEVRAALVREGERINILVLGLDDEGLRSDTIMLVSVDTDHKRVGAIQIPRDTRALLAGKGSIDKINAAYAYGVRDKQFPANLRALKSVESLLNVRIHYTVVVELDAFRMAIDEIGGVTVEIPFRMEYDDPYQNLHIHFEPGRQKLNGQQALEFVRWRHNNDGTGYQDGDLGRIRTQQDFLRAVIEQVLRPANLATLPTTATRVARFVESTIEPSRLASLALFAAGLDRNAIEIATLPGIDAYLLDPDIDERVSYYLHDPHETRKLVDRLVYGIDPDAAAQIRVEVVAAPGDARAAAIATRLAEQGFQVTQAALSGAPPAKTRIVPTTKEKVRSRFVARSLIAQGLEVEMVEEPDLNAGGVIRVILGATPRVR